MQSKNYENGFSLIEVLIAMAIVALIAVVSLPLFSYGIRNVKYGGDDSITLFEVESSIEDPENSKINVVKTEMQGSIFLDFNIVGKEPIKVNFYETRSQTEDISIFHFEYSDEE